jgi:hypothetical protein
MGQSAIGTLLRGGEPRSGRRKQRHSWYGEIGYRHPHPVVLVASPGPWSNGHGSGRLQDALAAEGAEAPSLVTRQFSENQRVAGAPPAPGPDG